MRPLARRRSRPIREGEGANGFDFRSRNFADMAKEGIIDPTKVTRATLADAASVATLLLTSDSLVSDLPKKDEKSSGGGMEDLC